MINWKFDPNDYVQQDFKPIPAGDHRVRISGVELKRFNSGNDGFEITLDVSGYTGKLWFYLVIDPSDPKKTNQRIGTFFESFGIVDPNLDHFVNWEGKIGGVRVKLEPYNGEDRPKVAFCLAKKNQDKLPAWKETAAAAPAATPAYGANPNLTPLNDDEELPFL